jgi:hypothetical protein
MQGKKRRTDKRGNEPYLRDKSKRGIINEIIKHDEGIAMASQVLMTISRDEVERARLLSEEKYILDTQSKVVHAK